MYSIIWMFGYCVHIRTLIPDFHLKSGKQIRKLKHSMYDDLYLRK